MSVNASAIRLISCDLDNALYDNRPVLAGAEQVLIDYLQAQFAAQSVNFDWSSFTQIKFELSRTKPIQYENMSLLRQDALYQFCASLKQSQHIAQQAFARFMQARSQLTISPLIISMLRLLAEQFILVSVSNGNVDVQQSPLALFFKANYSPQLGFRAKPHPQMLHQVMRDFDLAAEQILHLGDSLEADAEAARQAGVAFCYFAPFVDGEQILNYQTRLFAQLGI